jgi:hypothetical protein
MFFYSKAMSSMANLDVEISMSCMLVEIERPWLHADLFTDAEIDSGRFDISPGEQRLKDMYEKDQTVMGEYQQFSSYPTAFVVAADVELSVSFPLYQTYMCISLNFGVWSANAVVVLGRHNIPRVRDERVQHFGQFVRRIRPVFAECEPFAVEVEVQDEDGEYGHGVQVSFSAVIL